MVYFHFSKDYLCKEIHFSMNLSAAKVHFSNDCSKFSSMNVYGKTQQKTLFPLPVGENMLSLPTNRKVKHKL